MDGESVLKVRCPHCSGKIAFGREAANEMVPCPHCGQTIQLSLTKLMLAANRPPSAHSPGAPSARERGASKPGANPDPAA